LYEKFEERDESAAPFGTYQLSGTCMIEGNCDMAGLVTTSLVDLTYETCTGAYLFDVDNNVYTDISFTFANSPFLISGTFATTAEIAAAIQDVLRDENGYERIDETSLTAVADELSFMCRVGNPYLQCGQNTCGADSFIQLWTIGGPTWTGLTNIVAPLT
jgi:hypothetical protein